MDSDLSSEESSEIQLLQDLTAVVAIPIALPVAVPVTSLMSSEHIVMLS